MIEIFQINIGTKLSSIRLKCIDNIKKFASKNNYKYKMICADPDPNIMIRSSQADIIRHEYASKNPYALYCDTDLELNGLPDFESGRPYFARYKSRRVDAFLFYVNNCCSFFENLLNEGYIKRPDMARDWIAALLRDKKDDVYVIENEHFVHYGLRGEGYD